MPELVIHRDGYGPFAFADRDIVRLAADKPLHVACLPNGMVSGKPSIAFMFELPDGRCVFAETSLALFLGAANTFRSQHGDVEPGAIAVGLPEQRYESLRFYLEAHPKGLWRVHSGIYGGQERTTESLLSEDQALIWRDGFGIKHRLNMLDEPVLIRGTQVVFPAGRVIAGIKTEADVPVLERIR